MFVINTKHDHILISNICRVLDSHICSYHCFPMYHPLIYIDTSYLWNSTDGVRPGTRCQPYQTPYYYTILKSLSLVEESVVLDIVSFDIETLVGFTSLYRRSDPSLLINFLIPNYSGDCLHHSPYRISAHILEQLTWLCSMNHLDTLLNAIIPMCR